MDMKQDFYFIKEKGEANVTTAYYSSTNKKFITDKENDKREFEVLCPVPEKVTSAVLKGKLKVLNMAKLLERMR